MQAISPSGIESAQAGRWHGPGKAGEPAEGGNVICRQTGSRNAGLRHAVGDHSGGFLLLGGQRAVGGAQIAPVDLGAHFLTADGAVGQALDSRAMFYGDAGGFPLTDGAWRDAHHLCKKALASKVLCGAVDWVHAKSLDALDSGCQGGLNHFFQGGLIVGAWICAIESENYGAGTA